MKIPYYFDYKLFFSTVYRSLFNQSKVDTKLTIKRFIFLLIFVPLYLLQQLQNFICFFLDEIFFGSYKDLEIKKPLFITGVPRSGTTFMHRLFSMDDQFTAVKVWEMNYAPTITQKYFWSFIGKIDGIFGSPIKKLIIKMEDKVAGEFNKIHKIGTFETEEDEQLFMSSFTSLYLYFLFPDERILEYAFFDEKLSKEKRLKVMNYRKTLIQKHMYVFGKGKTYMTKNPADCPKIATIFEVFPDAKMIYLVRTPYQSVPSILNLVSHMYKAANGPMDNALLKKVSLMLSEYWYEYADKALATIPDEKKITVMYQDMVSDPIAVTEKAYGHLGYDISDYFNQVLIEQTEKSKQYKSKHKYDVSTHGMTNDFIRETYKDVFEKYDLEKAV